MTLGERLKTEREKKNWTQKYVAEKAGITNSVLSNYERDYRDPDTSTLKRLADLYEVEADYLLGRSNKTEDNKSNNDSDDQYLRWKPIIMTLEKHGITPSHIKSILKAFRDL